MELQIRKHIFSIIRPYKTRPAEALLTLAATGRQINAKSRRRILRWGLISGNLLLLLAAGFFVITNRSASQTVRASTLQSAVATANSASKPLDTLSSSQIALTAAQMANLAELTAIHNKADSDSLILAVVPNDATILTKPQIVSTSQKSKQDIIKHNTQPGDTVSTLSAKYGVSAESIRWSNNISGNNLPASKVLIPPVNGIVYTVKQGDTPAAIASRFSADESQIIIFNDAEIAGLKPGEQIIIPNGRVAPVITAYRDYQPTSGLGLYSASYSGNSYSFGYCTYYAASRIAVPSNWGNANTWDDYARLSGWTVSNRPSVGSIFQTDVGWAGHVGIVEAVSPDGNTMKYSDMNALAGWGRVGYSGWVPASTFPRYISR